MSEQTTNNQDDIITRPVAWIVNKKGRELFNEWAMRVEIVDEAGGEFVEVTDGDQSKIRIDPVEWEQLKTTISNAIEEIKQHEVKL
jgi:hypothetical protein